jgi:hypothetical protein
MTIATSEFCKQVAQVIEFAGFGPCAALPSAVVVQAFDGTRSFPVLPNLTVKGLTEGNGWCFPNVLSPTTLAVAQIIEDAFVMKGMPPPGYNSTMKIESSDLPFHIEVRYLWLTDPEEDARAVVALLLEQGIPVWATESRLGYHDHRDRFIASRIKSLLGTYASTHPAPNKEILELTPEIIETVESL